MLRTLRRRFVLSHLLPVLVIIPLIGLALAYLLETQILLPSLSNELKGDALLIAEIIRDDLGILQDQDRAEAILTRLDPSVKGRVMLLDATGHILASSNPDDANRLGQQLEHPDLDTVLAGKLTTRTEHSQHLQAEIADVMVAVENADGQTSGIVRLSYPLTSVHEQFLRLRYLIGGVLVAGLVLGTALGLLLALNLERPLRQLTQAALQLGGGERLKPLPEEGPEEVRSLLKAFNNLVQRLRSLEKARRQLLANLVHELGRPLGALRAAAEALLSGADEDTSLRRELLVGINAELDRLEHLLRDLSSLHDTVLGTLELNREPVAMSAWLRNTITVWREAASAKGLQWQDSIPPDLPTLHVDKDRLGQALGNLIGNAIKYTPQGGSVSVSAGTENQAFWVKVSDTGRGIDAAEQERVFEPFYRSRSARRFPQGLGLGLSIARDLVVAHRGRLELQSTPGQGSQFTVWLSLNT
jgi:two-component system sensor histidine kinase BaeS